MDNYDKLLKVLISRNSEDKEHTECLSEELFAAYLNNILDNAAREKVENHLYLCSACRKQSTILNRVKQGLEKEELMRASQGITDRAKSLVKAKTYKSLLEVVLEFAKDSVRILKDTGAMFTPLGLATAGVRQGTTAEMKNVVHLSNTFDEIKADIIVERVDDITYEMNIKTSDSKSGALINDLRINLLLGKRELASFMTINGQVSFKNIQNGIYELHIVKSKEVIGRISLELESVK